MADSVLGDFLSSIASIGRAFADPTDPVAAEAIQLTERGAQLNYLIAETMAQFQAACVRGDADEAVRLSALNAEQGAELRRLTLRQQALYSARALESGTKQ